MSKPKTKHTLHLPFPVIMGIFVLVWLIFRLAHLSLQQKQNQLFPLPSPSASISKFSDFKLPPPLPTVTPTPRPLTFSELNQLYGPCVHLPTLFYHHIEPSSVAKQENHTSLNVDLEIFSSQMRYLNDHGYSTVSPQNLINFFDSGTPLPLKPVLITFDDGYSDFAVYAFPILKQYAFQATMFLPTGLVNNPGYLNWGNITEIDHTGKILFANHTWSHYSVARNDPNTLAKEISTAAQQLRDHGIPGWNIFAYPYGSTSPAAISYLSQNGYALAFTTRPGNVMCKQQRLSLPRTRIGNNSLSYYGL
jgi:peptidoglycan/xylan/chitin deacetylase (PgdA/CDA1 family)